MEHSMTLELDRAIPGDNGVLSLSFCWRHNFIWSAQELVDSCNLQEDDYGL